MNLQRILSRRVKLFSSTTTSNSIPGIGLSLTSEQKELQDLAKKFTLQEIIPKVQSDLYTI